MDHNQRPQLFTSIHAHATNIASKPISIYSDGCNSFRNPHNHSHDETCGSSMADSGYTSSNFNVTTPNQTPNVSTQQHQHTLATIEEGDEQQPTKITPTTQTQLRLLSFHLTTPKGLEGIAGPSIYGDEPTNSSDLFDNISLTPPRRVDSGEEATNDEPRTPARSLCSAENSQTANSTPRKPKIGSKRKRCAFREKLYSDPVPDSKRTCLDVTDAENNVNFDVGQLEFSPICKSSVKQVAKVLSDLGNYNLDTTMTSSTPKHDGFRSNFYVEKQASVHKHMFPLKSGSPKKRTKLFRRFQSFSPGKLKEVRGPGAGGSDYRRFLFRGDKKPTATATQTSSGAEPKKKLQRQMALVEEEDEETAIKYYDPVVRHSEAASQPFDLCVPCTPEKMNISNETLEAEALLLATPMAAELNKKISLDDVRDPGYEHVHDAAVAEKMKILYPQLPPTPPRIAEGTPSKVRSSATKVPSTPNRDSFYFGKNRKHIVRQSYEGIDKFNILSRLFELSQVTPIAQILHLLPDNDLENVFWVSHHWREILVQDKVANRRRLLCIKARIPGKENCGSVEFAMAKGKTSLPRQPFSNCNKDLGRSLLMKGGAETLSDSSLSPPASPSKRKFRENQKVIRKLSRRTKVTTCPRCSKPSPISESNSKLMKHKSRLRKAISLPTRSSPLNQHRPKPSKFQHYHTLSGDSQQSGNSEEDDSDDHGHLNWRRNLFSGDGASAKKGQLLKSHSLDTKAMFLTNSHRQVSLEDSLYTTMSPQPATSVSSGRKKRRKTLRQTPVAGSTAMPKYDYAICSGQNCRFKFCIRCLCKYHPGEVCASELQPYSPGKEAEKRQQIQNVMCTEQSKRTLRRLCKLDK